MEHGITGACAWCLAIDGEPHYSWCDRPREPKQLPFLPADDYGDPVQYNGVEARIADVIESDPCLTEEDGYLSAYVQPMDYRDRPVQYDGVEARTEDAIEVAQEQPSWKEFYGGVEARNNPSFRAEDIIGLFEDSADTEVETEAQGYHRQVGGDHYARFPIQPSHFCYKNGLNNFQSEVINYTVRAPFKGQQVEDIQKAIHTLEMWLEELWEEGESRDGE
jgi:hypothetical protein